MDKDAADSYTMTLDLSAETWVPKVVTFAEGGEVQLETSDGSRQTIEIEDPTGKKDPTTIPAPFTPPSAGIWTAIYTTQKGRLVKGTIHVTHGM